MGAGGGRGEGCAIRSVKAGVELAIGRAASGGGGRQGRCAFAAPPPPCRRLSASLSRSFALLPRFPCLADAHERIVVGKEFADDPIGLYVVRGENVVFLGDIDETRDPPAGLTRVSVKEAKRAQQAEREAGRIRGTLLASMDFLDE